MTQNEKDKSILLLSGLSLDFIEYCVENDVDSDFINKILVNFVKLLHIIRKSD